MQWHECANYGTENMKLVISMKKVLYRHVLLLCKTVLQGCVPRPLPLRLYGAPL